MQVVEVIEGALDWCSTGFLLSGGHERAPTPFLVLLLIRTVGGAFINVLIPLRLASRVIKNYSNHLLAGSVASRDVEEFLGSLWALTSKLMDQGLAGGP